MKPVSQKISTRRRAGFTLVELLVVIAIIGILAGIVLPNVSAYIYKSQLAAAVADIQSVDTALTGMLSDTERSDFRNWFKTTGLSAEAQSIVDNEILLDTYLQGATPLSTNEVGLQTVVGQLTDSYTIMMYQLLRQGKNAEIASDLKPEIRQKLGNSYIELGQDPWDQQYQFWLGPMRGRPVQFFRSYRLEPGVTDSDDMDLSEVYFYGTYNAGIANDEVPGSPRQDYEGETDDLDNDGKTGDQRGTFALSGNNELLALYGFPASKDLPMYVYSRGKNNLTDANAIIQQAEGALDFAFWGGGDDINNWDNEAGWQAAPR